MRWLLKRWWFLAAAGFMLVAVCAGYLLIPVGEGGISQANCDKIQIGLADSEICNTLDGLGQQFFQFSFAWRGPDRTESWFDDEGNVITVAFVERRVTEKHFTPSRLSLWERMKRRIERRIKALWP
jgi:hypothetical protein